MYNLHETKLPAASSGVGSSRHQARAALPKDLRKVLGANGYAKMRLRKWVVNTGFFGCLIGKNIIYIYINMYMYYNPPALYDMWRITVHNDDSQSGFCGTTCWISMSTINCDEVSATCDNFHTTPYDACACFRSTYQNKGFDSSSIFFEENACNLHMISMICILCGIRRIEI